MQAFKYVGNGFGSLASFLGNKYQEYDINNKLKAGGSATLKGLTTAGNYLYDLSKPIVKYASDKATQGVGSLYNQVTGNNKNNEEINRVEKENDEDKGEIVINCINSEEDNDVKDNNQIFKKPDDEKEKKEENEEKEEKEENENNVIEIREDYPTFSKINLINENENESNISAAPINKK